MLKRFGVFPVSRCLLSSEVVKRIAYSYWPTMYMYYIQYIVYRFKIHPVECIPVSHINHSCTLKLSSYPSTWKWRSRVGWIGLFMNPTWTVMKTNWMLKTDRFHQYSKVIQGSLWHLWGDFCPSFSSEWNIQIPSKIDFPDDSSSAYSLWMLLVIFVGFIRHTWVVVQWRSRHPRPLKPESEAICWWVSHAAVSCGDG